MSPVFQGIVEVLILDSFLNSLGLSLEFFLASTLCQNTVVGSVETEFCFDSLNVLYLVEGHAESSGFTERGHLSPLGDQGKLPVEIIYELILEG